MRIEVEYLINDVTIKVLHRKNKNDYIGKIFYKENGVQVVEKTLFGLLHRLVKDFNDSSLEWKYYDLIEVDLITREVIEDITLKLFVEERDQKIKSIIDGNED